MADESGGGKKWLKYGCFGCLGLLVLVLLIAGSVGGMAWFQASSMKAEEEVLTREVPEAARPAETPGVAPDALAADLPGAADRLAGFPKGRVVLHMQNADMHVEPAPPGEPFRVEASYDRNTCELVERLDGAADGAWTYTLTFKRRGFSSPITTLAELISGASPKVTVFLPRDVPYDLEMRLMEGGARVELGGLWLTNADIHLQAGGFELGVSEPLREPLERMTLRTSMAGGAIKSLGNASPRNLDVQHRMGGLALDLRGRWVEDSKISIDLSMGGGAVMLPKNVIVEGVPGRARVTGGTEGKIPRLTIDSASSMGDLEFVN